MALDKLPGEHGDSINYETLNLLMWTFGVGLVIGVIFFSLVA